jgi:hypothetical protein
MQKLIVTMVLAASVLMSVPASAQTKLTPKTPAARADNCAPIGRTANGELVYSMKCDNLPAPVAPPQARMDETAPPPPPPPEAQRGGSGLFGWSYDRRPTDQ